MQYLIRIIGNILSDHVERGRKVGSSFGFDQRKNFFNSRRRLIRQSIVHSFGVESDQSDLIIYSKKITCKSLKTYDEESDRISLTKEYISGR